jgi:heptosyltransferase-2
VANYKVLIIKIGALGDAVMASFMIQTVRSIYPEAHITWLCGQEIFDLVKSFKGIDIVLSVDNKLLAGGFFSKIRFVLKCLKTLLGRKFDLCVTGNSDFRYRILSVSAICKIRRHFGGRFGPLPGRYHGIEYARLILGHDHSVETHYSPAEIDVTPSEASKNMVLLLPGGARNIMRESNHRRWPLEKYRELAEALISHGIPVGIIGNEADLWVEEGFKGLNIKSFIGKADIQTLLSLIAGARALVAHDSGPVHIAYLLKTPAVVLYGPTMPESFLPYKLHQSAISKKLPCSPCYDGRNYADCKNNICMNSINTDEVLKKLEEMSLI